jgi:cytochrome c-type biogenesis protein CcmH/NrfG
MNKKEMTSNEKTIALKTAVISSIITLVVGFLGGIIFSAFKMDNTLSGMSAMVATETEETGSVLTDEEKDQLQALQQAAGAAPEDATAWIALGNACFDYNLNPQAIQAYETALEIQPDNADVCTDLGTAYRRNGEPEKAVDYYEKAQRILPGHQMSLLNQGIVCLHDLNDTEGAISAWEKLLEVNPTATTSGGMLIKNLVDTLKSQQ